MALEMKCGPKGCRFEFADGEAETTVTLLPEDDQETLVRKLRRIIALTEGEPKGWDEVFHTPTSPNALRRDMPRAPVLPVRTAPEAPPQLGEEQVANGWKLYEDAIKEANGEGA